jgi:hypothetical protein
MLLVMVKDSTSSGTFINTNHCSPPEGQKDSKPDSCKSQTTRYEPEKALVGCHISDIICIHTKERTDKRQGQKYDGDYPNH